LGNNSAMWVTQPPNPIFGSSAAIVGPQPENPIFGNTAPMGTQLEKSHLWQKVVHLWGHSCRIPIFGNSAAMWDTNGQQHRQQESGGVSNHG
jgi:hypothetical protein